ncbi:hypothetical protein P175DRAFT_0470935 [Aspergillus ochraceoroseus IBT 24754]|uniref:Major facilitator superfamily (MFS) profile domain-containing protein n=2 Tax=Aspergillus subgen. Nidulantes TaxID=2720870 RepID=A0A0F8U0Y6_9EURO|nr:uncharacterized protein P175DRAFT_0470935 [Aspergillus ochraceoroseus IBT 24754]KKK13208.1 hypothetical protein ARAM_000548 [Aspergillus rambellii]PTU24640.1 hypothetical protein P175DRAFT_0470935 [Aspergillus ochraceoroseus IBT 24754]
MKEQVSGEDGKQVTVISTETGTPENDIGLFQDPNQRPRCFTSTFQECIFVLTTTMAIGQSSFFQGAVIVISATIGRDLHMNQAEITWITAGNSLTSGALLLAFGKVADMFGRRSMFITGMAGFTLALVVAGFANSAIYMDVFSGILGIFSAAVVPPAVGSLGAVYERPSQRKNRAFACFSAGNPLGFVGGMIVSGIATQVADWRAALWVLAVIYAAFTVLTIWTVPQDLAQKTRGFSWDSVKSLDPLGMILAMAGIALLSSSLSIAGDAPDGWKTPYVIVLLVLGVALIAGFLYWQSLFSTPLMPLHVWRDRNFSLLMGILALGFSGFVAAQFWMALYMQEVLNLGPLEITARLLPMVVNGVLVNIVCAFLLHRVSNKLIMLTGTVAYAVAFLIMSFTPDQGLYWAYYFVPLLLLVVGADCQFNVVNMYVMSSLPTSDQSLAGAIFNTVSKVAGNIGLGITTAIYNAIREGGSTSPIRPYLGPYWFAAASAGIAVFLVPFLKIGTQGHSEKDPSLSNEPDEELGGLEAQVKT